MRIDRLVLTGFGRFQGRTLDLSPGLNLIYGTNEAGKTTLQRFILGMLYGFQKKAARRSFTEDAARYRPWQGGEYRGALVYTLDGTGLTCRVEREFEPGRERAAVFDAQTGADLSGRFPLDRRKELLFAEEHLGLSEEVFRSTAWIGQLEVGKLELGRELVARVANLQESGREDLSVKNALRLLEERMREIGSDRAPTRPYARLGRQIEEKRLELERAAAAREETLAWEAQQTEVRAVLAEMDEELAALYRRTDWAKLREAEERLERVAAAGRKVREARLQAEMHGAYAGFPVHLRERLIQRQTQAESARQAAAGYEADATAVQAQSAELAEGLASQGDLGTAGPAVERELAAVEQAERAAQAQLPGLDEEADRLAGMVARLDEATLPLRPAAERGAEILAQVETLDREMAALRPRLEVQTLENLEREVAALEREARQFGGWGWLVLSGSMAAAAAAGAYFAWLIAAGGLAVAAAGALIPFAFARQRAGRVAREARGARERRLEVQQWVGQIQERMTALERRKERALQEIGLTEAAEVRNRVVRYEQLSARRDGQQMRLSAVDRERDRLRAEVQQRRQGLEQLIAGALGLTPAELRQGPDPAERFRLAFAAYRARQRRLDQLRDQAAGAGRRLRAELETAGRLEQEMAAMLAEAGVSSAEAFAEGCSRHESWRKAIAEADSLESALGSLLGGEAPAALEAQIEQLRSGLEGAKPAEAAESALLQAEARRLEARRADLNARASDLSARVETALKDLPDIADLRRELQALQAERQALDEELTALDLARSVITEVSSELHREFAPRLNRAMGQVVAELTAGKYRTVKIDEEAQIRVITAADRTVDLVSLSGGTGDQFYLGLRIALLDLLSQGQERSPLILDDPFVQYDDERLRAGLEYLGALSRERQILLMTCHQREVRTAQALGVPVNFVTLSDQR